jgi:glutamyl-tRNA reductase
VKLICVGLSHKTASVDKREKASFSASAARAMLSDLTCVDGVSEAVALSTCNRTELYAVGSDTSHLEETLCATLVRHSVIPRAELDGARYIHHEPHVAAHLFRVASGLDSMVVGESEIQGQVRGAWELAREQGATGSVLNHLFRQAVETGKRVRNETRISEGPTSVSAVAVQLARQAFPDLSHRRALLIGAGQMAEATARALVAAGLTNVAIASRTESKAQALTDRVGGRGVGSDQIDEELASADIVISSTDAPNLILDRGDVERAMVSRPDRRMLLIDIAVPRDLDASIGEIPGVTLHDIDGLERVVQASMGDRLRETGEASLLVVAEARRFVQWRKGLSVTPTIVSLRERAEAIRRAEMEELSQQCGSLAPEDLRRLDIATKTIVSKLLHEPTVRLRAAAVGDELPEMITTLRHLFDLDRSPHGLLEAS